MGVWAGLPGHIGEMVRRGNGNGAHCVPTRDSRAHIRHLGRAAERAIVAHTGPDAADVGLDLGEHGHGGIVAVQPLGGEHMGP